MSIENQKPSYLNLLSISSDLKGIPYLGGGVKREDGGANYGFKNLKSNPELIDGIPELVSDEALKSLVYAINFSETGLFSIGCLGHEVSEERGYRYTGYIEFAFNSKLSIQNVINYFIAYFHFDKLLKQEFIEPVKFDWVLEPAHFSEVNIAGFSCSVIINTTYFASREEAYQCWKAGLKILEIFLSSIPKQTSEEIY